MSQLDFGTASSMTEGHMELDAPALLRQCFGNTMKFALPLVWVALACPLVAQPDPHWLVHDRLRPAPPPITPPEPGSQAQPGRAPSDATVLFDGGDASAWVAMDGSPTQWVVRDGALECTPAAGYVRTLQAFGDCQLHIEWAAPNAAHGQGQARGNSGIFFGLNRYEIQVLDSYGSTTYADGGAAAIYGQYPPLVNASLPAGQWQSYDIIWIAPRFDASGTLLSKARLTVFHNGVLVHNQVELTGPTAWIGRPHYQPHPVRLPIALQDHGHPVRYRNIWVRELTAYREREILPPEKVLNSYLGNFAKGDFQVSVTRRADGLLSLHMGGAETTLHAASLTRFYSADTDLLCEFSPDGATLAASVAAPLEHAIRMDRR